MEKNGGSKKTYYRTQVDESDVGSDRFQCGIISEPMSDHMGSDNPIESYWIPGDGIRSEVVGGGSHRIFCWIRSSDPMDQKEPSLVLLKRSLVKFVTFDICLIGYYRNPSTGIR